MAGLSGDSWSLDCIRWGPIHKYWIHGERVSSGARSSKKCKEKEEAYRGMRWIVIFVSFNKCFWKNYEMINHKFISAFFYHNISNLFFINTCMYVKLILHSDIWRSQLLESKKSQKTCSTFKENMSSNNQEKRNILNFHLSSRYFS